MATLQPDWPLTQEAQEWLGVRIRPDLGHLDWRRLAESPDPRRRPQPTRYWRSANAHPSSDCASRAVPRATEYAMMRVAGIE